MKNILFVLLLAVAPSLLLAQNLEIHWPLERAVFQRNAADQATIVVQGQYAAGTPVMKYRLVKLKLKEGTDDSIDENWTDIIPHHNNTIHKVFRKSFTNKIKGWYRIDFSTDGNNVIKFIKFGIGDVYLIAGQSNAQGGEEQYDIGLTNYFSEMATLYDRYYDCVNVVESNLNNREDNHDPIIWESKKINKFVQLEQLTNVPPAGNKSHSYAVLGAEIAINQQVPVVFFNTARTATSAWHWYKTSIDNNLGVAIFFSTNIYEPVGSPYKVFKKTLNLYNSLFGIRAILWHQGESDNRFKTTYANDGSDKGDLVDNYQSRLNSIIGSSRTDFKNTNNNISWFVSQASYDGGLSNPINTTLTGIQNNIATINKHGVSTDDIGLTHSIFGATRNARNDFGKVHFSDWGLYELGKRWAAKQPWTGNPINAEELLQLTINGTQLSVNSVAGATNYLWVKDENLEAPLQSGTSTTFNYPNVAGTYRCYVLQDGKNYLISEAYKPAVVLGINYLSVTPEGPVNISSSSETVQITVNSFSNWSVTSSSWIHPTVTSGAAGNNWAFNCNIDANGGATRQGTIVITNNNSTHTIYINQAAGLDIVLGSSVINVGANAYYTSINITAINTSWTAVKSDGWFSISPTSGGNGDTNMAIQLNANPSSSRTGTITFTGTGTGIVKTLTINQTGSGLSPCYDCVGHLDGAWCPSAGSWAKRNGQATNFDVYIDGQLVQSNIAPNYNRPDVGGYFGLNYTYPECYRNGQNHEITIKFAGTSTALPNSPKIFNCTGGNCTGGGSNSLSVSPTSITFTNSSGSQNSTISSTNVNWTASTSNSWITLSTSSGGNGTINLPINVQQNTSSAARTGIVSISGGGFSNTVSILQNGVSSVCVNCTGSLDGAWCPSAGGWAKKNGGTTNIDVYIDGQLVQSNMPPNYNRPDVGGYFGFVYAYPACYKNGQNHSLSFKHAGTTTELNNSPQIFNCSGGNCNNGNNLTISNGSLAFTSQISTQSVNVNSTNVNWTATSSVGWLSVTPSSGGNGVTTISVSAQQNTQNTSRTGTINISGGGFSQTINVTQDASGSNNVCVNCEGYLDGAWCPTAGGWAKKNGGSTNIDVYIDNQLIQSNMPPNYNRPDVGGYFGFVYAYPECYKNGQNHSLSFKHAGTNTQLNNSPQIFNCTGGNCGSRVATKEETQLLNLETNSENKFSIFPNPTNDKLTTKFSLAEASKVSFDIVDMQGRKFENYQYIGEAGNHTFIIDVSQLNVGSYLLRGLIANKLEIKKFVIER